MVADASALLALLLKEDDYAEHEAKLRAAKLIWLSPVNWWEVQVRMKTEFGEAGERVANGVLESLEVMIAPVTAEQARIAFAASVKFGGRPARLNMGDCFAYALAKEKGAPLIYKGGDFAKTDIGGRAGPR